MPLLSFEISTTNDSSLVNVETFSPPPLATPVMRALAEETSAGTVIEQGGYTCEWALSGLTESQYDAWRTKIPNKTQTCWIRTIEENKFDYAYYTGYVIWPNPEDIVRPVSPKYATGQFVLRFRNLIKYTPSP